MQPQAQYQDSFINKMQPTQPPLTASELSLENSKSNNNASVKDSMSALMLRSKSLLDSVHQYQEMQESEQDRKETAEMVVQPESVSMYSQQPPRTVEDFKIQRTGSGGRRICPEGGAQQICAVEPVHSDLVTPRDDAEPVVDQKSEHTSSHESPDPQNMDESMPPTVSLSLEAGSAARPVVEQSS